MVTGKRFTKQTKAAKGRSVSFHCSIPDELEAAANAARVPRSQYVDRIVTQAIARHNVTVGLSSALVDATNVEGTAMDRMEALAKRLDGFTATTELKFNQLLAQGEIAARKSGSNVVLEQIHSLVETVHGIIEMSKSQQEALGMANNNIKVLGQNMQSLFALMTKMSEQITNLQPASPAKVQTTAPTGPAKVPAGVAAAMKSGDKQ